VEDTPAAKRECPPAAEGTPAAECKRAPAAEPAAEGAPAAKRKRAPAVEPAAEGSAAAEPATTEPAAATPDELYALVGGSAVAGAFVQAGRGGCGRAGRHQEDDQHHTRGEPGKQEGDPAHARSSSTIQVPLLFGCMRASEAHSGQTLICRSNVPRSPARCALPAAPAWA
jgi:hypothetical protein